MAAVDIVVPLARRHWLGEAVRRHPTVVAGLLILFAMGAVAVLAPWLGTSDPLTVSPIRRLRFPAARILVRHRRLWPRRLQPHALWRARVAAGRPRRRIVQHRPRPRHRPRHRLQPARRRHPDARHGRAHVGAAGAAGDRADGAHQGEPRQRHPRHHHLRGAARRAPRARRRARPARAALRRGGVWRRAPASCARCSATSCPTRSRRCWCRRAISAPRR